MIYNKVFLVNSQVGVDTGGSTTFSLYEGDMLITDHERICTLIYKTSSDIFNPGKKDLTNTLHLLGNKQRIYTSIRVANRTNWYPMVDLIGKELTDITIEYNRSKALDEIL